MKLASSGRMVEGGISVTCPNKCSIPTFILNGNIHSLPKNFAVMDIIHERHATLRNRSPSLSSRSFLLAPPPSSPPKPITEDEYYCDVCETNHAILVCPSCAVFLCQECSDDIHSRRGYKVHLIVPVVDFFMNSGDSILSGDSGVSSLSQRSEFDCSFEDQQKHCKSHSSEILDYICETCCEEVCKLCRTSVDHKDHECRLLSDVAMEKQGALRRMIDKVNQCHVEWCKGFDECKELQEHLYHKQQNMEATIKSHFHSIHSLLHAKEEHLLANARSEIEHRSQMLNTQAE